MLPVLPGVMVDDMVAVELLALPEGGRRLAALQFQAEQQIEPLPSGACRGRLRSAGIDELRVQVFLWGTALQGITPDAFRSHTGPVMRSRSRCPPHEVGEITA